MVIAYRTYPKENLLTVTLKIEQNKSVFEANAYLRFSQGFKKDNGRGYDTNSSIVIKFTLFELAALGKAFKYAAANQGNSTYIKFSNSEKSKNGSGGLKKVTLDKQYLNASEKERFVGIRFTRYEMDAISDDIRLMVEVANKTLWKLWQKENNGQ